MLFLKRLMPGSIACQIAKRACPGKEKWFDISKHMTIVGFGTAGILHRLEDRGFIDLDFNDFLGRKKPRGKKERVVVFQQLLGCKHTPISSGRRICINSKQCCVSSRF